MMKRWRIAAGAAVVALGAVSMPMVADGSPAAQAFPERIVPDGQEPAKQAHRSTVGTRDTAEEKSAESPVQAIAAEGLTYYPVNPYRTYDSREYEDGFLPGGFETYFDVLTDSAGTPQIPEGAMAVTYNLAIVGTVGSGFLALYPADINWPGNASINWTQSGTVLSNGGTVAIGEYTGPGELAVYAGPAGFPIGTDFVIDITGFYM